MKKYLNKISKVIFGFFVFLVLVNLTIFNTYAGSSKVNLVNDKYSSDEEYFDTYTDSDNFYFDEYKNITINDYEDKYGINNIAKDIKDGFAKNYEFVINGDDPIINIIPRELFEKRGEYLHIGREYGFYVKTSELTTNENLIDVFVFDITKHQLDNPKYPSQYVIEVKPLFQYSYFLLLTESSEYIKSLKINKNELNILLNVSNDNVITPLFIYETNQIINNEYFYCNKFIITDFPLKYASSAKSYCIKNIEFGLSLYNEQEANIGDINYDKNKDNGSFIVRTNINYNGETNGSIGSLCHTTIGLGVGFIPYVGDVYSVVDTIATFCSDIYEYTNTNVSYEDMYESSMYTTKEEQLDHYVNLSKAGYVSLHSDNKKPLFFSAKNKNNYVKAFFTLGMTEDWLTRAYDSIKFDIVDHSCNVIKTGYRQTKNYLRSNNGKNLEIDNTYNFRLLAEGVYSFKFDAKYSSYYSINISTFYQMSLLVDDILYDPNEFDKIKLSKGEHIIKIIGNNRDSVISSITISPLCLDIDDYLDVSLEENEEILVKLNTKHNMYSLSTGDKDVVIDNIFINSKFDENRSFGIKSYYTIDYPFDLGTYYVKIRNTSSKNKSIKFSKNDIISIDLDKELTINTNFNNFTYVKFNSVDSSEYMLTCDLYDEINFKIINEDNYSTTYGTYWFDSYYQFSANSYIYIGIKSSSNTLKIKLKKIISEYKWRISYDDKVEEIAPESKYFINRKKDCYFELLYNGEVVNNVTYGDTPNSTSFGEYAYKFSKIYGKHYLYFHGDCPVGGDGIVVEAKNDDNVKLSSIKIIPKIDDYYSNLVKSLTNTEELGFNYNMPGYVYKFDYQIYPYDRVFTASIKESRGYISILEDFRDLEETNSKDITIRILKIYYVDALTRPYTLENDWTYEKTTNNLYESGNGNEANPYKISYKRHLENIQYNHNKDFTVSKDIDVKNWKSFNMFSGTLDGNDKTLTVDINVEKYTGDVGLFTLNTGTIKNLNLQMKIVLTSESDSWQNIGGICSVNQGTIKNCRLLSYNRYTKAPDVEATETNVDFFITSKSNIRIGGITGYNKGIIDECVNEGTTLFGSGDMGGIAGASVNNDSKPAKISNCINKGSVYYYWKDSNRSVGGIVGYQESGTILNCENVDDTIISFEIDAGKSKVIQPNMGQIVGHSQGEVIGSKSAGNVDTSGLAFQPGFIPGIGFFDQLKYAKAREIGKRG